LGDHLLHRMKDANDALRELQDTLDSLSPHDFAAWTTWVEERLTERLRQRQAHPAGLPVSDPEPGEETEHA
jgi:hypothetical protein